LRTKDREAIATLESRAFVLDFVRRQNALPHLFPELWDGGTKKWKTKTGSPPTDNAAYARFKNKIMKIRRDSEKSTVEVSVRVVDRTLAADWANALVAQLNEKLRQRAIAEATQSLSFLDKELVRTPQVQIRGAIYALVEAQTKEVMLANVRHDYAFRIIDPAAPADPGGYVFPQRFLIAVVGAFMGLFVAVAIVILRNRS
jgi:uncharacterized protein involved in exopolysaccharide biosynthesis